jgi:hypothetical protein
MTPRLALLLLAAALPAQNCGRTSINETPLTDLAAGSYRGFQGGLYAGGSNQPPAAHAAAGALQAAAVQPLDANGQPNPSGRIVLVSIGMSNTTQEFSTWLPISNADPQRNGAVVVVDGAQGGQDARIVANPNANFWNVVNQRLANASVTPLQVQVAWLKEAVAGPTLGFPAHAQELQGLLVQIAQNLRAKYPNLRLAFVSSRIYAGYATTALNPEPYAYESGFAVKWLIDQQVNGDAALNFDPARGAVRAPFLAWGPYLWADGLRPRGDGLTWVCADLQSDGTHPSPSGRQKVAAMLDAHFRGDAFCTPWYLGANQRAAMVRYGAGCPGGGGPLATRWSSLPFLGNAAFGYGVTNARAGSPAAAFFATARGSLALDAQCTLLVDPARVAVVIGLATNATGTATLRIAVPNDAGLAGLQLPSQWLVLDPAAPGLRMLGGGALSEGVELRLGTP